MPIAIISDRYAVRGLTLCIQAIVSIIGYAVYIGKLPTSEPTTHSRCNADMDSGFCSIGKRSRSLCGPPDRRALYLRCWNRRDDMDLEQHRTLRPSHKRHIVCLHDDAIGNPPFYMAVWSALPWATLCVRDDGVAGVPGRDSAVLACDDGVPRSGEPEEGTTARGIRKCAGDRGRCARNAGGQEHHGERQHLVQIRHVVLKLLTTSSGHSASFHTHLPVDTPRLAFVTHYDPRAFSHSL